MALFVGREQEPRWLQEGWDSGQPRFRVLYGRLRVGKSALLDQFARDTCTILYQAVEGTSADQLCDLTAAVLACEDNPVLRAAPLANWGQAFEDICRTWVASAGDSGLISRIGAVGACWGPVPNPLPTNPRHHSEGEIEVIATQGARLVLAGKAKWTKEPVGFGVLNHLREVVAHVPGADSATRLILFGRVFDPKLQTAAATEGVRLITADDLYT